MYCEGRYFTVTGNAWEYPGVLRTISADEFREIHTLLFGGNTPAPTPRELRIAGVMAEIFANTVAEPYYRVYWSPTMADALKRQGITIGGYRDERMHIEDILLADYHIAAGKEGNTPTGRKYYYDATNEHAQAYQGRVDLLLKNGRCQQAPSDTEDQNK